MNSKFGILLVCVALFLSCAKDNEKTLYVADSKVDCVGVSPQKCLQIKENETDDWSNFYGHIEGFDYREGYSYKLKVEETKIENPPADTSALKYTLVEILEQTKTPINIDKGSWMVTLLKDQTNFDRNPTLSIKNNEIHGSTSCNKFFGNVVIVNSNFKTNTIGATKMMCKNMETEQLFLETLNQVTSYKIENDVLKFMNSNNEVVMECSHLAQKE